MFPDGAELPQLCAQDPEGELRVIGGMDALDRLNDAGSLRAECDAFKATRRVEYEARKGAIALREEPESHVRALESRVRQMEEREAAGRAAHERASAELLLARSAAVDAVRLSDQMHGETEELEKSVARLECKLDQASRALEAALALIGALSSFTRAH